jgi:hypothetical protein
MVKAGSTGLAYGTVFFISGMAAWTALSFGTAMGEHAAPRIPASKSTSELFILFNFS